MIQRSTTSARLTRLLLEVLGLLAMTQAAVAQPVSGYVGAGPGIYTNEVASGGLMHVAGGVDVAPSHFVSVGSDIGLLLGAGDAAAPIAFSASAHIPTSGHFDPYVRGGYTRVVFLSEGGGANAAHVGGGFTYWFSPNRAWSVEVRAVRPRFASRYWVARLGIAFR